MAAKSAMAAKDREGIARVGRSSICAQGSQDNDITHAQHRCIAAHELISDGGARSEEDMSDAASIESRDSNQTITQAAFDRDIRRENPIPRQRARFRQNTTNQVHLNVVPSATVGKAGNSLLKPSTGCFLKFDGLDSRLKCLKPDCRRMTSCWGKSALSQHITQSFLPTALPFEISTDFSFSRSCRCHLPCMWPLLVHPLLQ